MCDCMCFGVCCCVSARVFWSLLLCECACVGFVGG